MQALIRLAKRTKMLPRSYLLEGVSIGEVMFQTSSVDIHRGVYGERQVCLKKYRGCTQSRSQPADSQDLDRMTEVSIISRDVLVATLNSTPTVRHQSGRLSSGLIATTLAFFLSKEPFWQTVTPRRCT